MSEMIVEFDVQTEANLCLGELSLINERLVLACGALV